MNLIDRIGYWAKRRLPGLYSSAAYVNRFVTTLLYGRRIARALSVAHIEGTVANQSALMRPLKERDVDSVIGMIETMPKAHLTYFHPHKFDVKALNDVIVRRDIMTYGLFVNNKLSAYAILKLFSTRKAYIGRLVCPEMAGLGIGKYISRYLYWQAYTLGFQPCSTISKDYLASMQSHASVRPFEVVASLPNNFQLIRFTLLADDAYPPSLEIETNNTKD